MSCSDNYHYVCSEVIGNRHTGVYMQPLEPKISQGCWPFHRNKSTLHKKRTNDIHEVAMKTIPHPEYNERIGNQ